MYFSEFLQYEYVKKNNNLLINDFGHYLLQCAGLYIEPNAKSPRFPHLIKTEFYDAEKQVI